MIALIHLIQIIVTMTYIGWRRALIFPLLIVNLLYGVGLPLFCAGIGVGFLVATSPQELESLDVGMLFFVGFTFLILLGAFVFAELWRWHSVLLIWRGAALMRAKQYSDALAIFQRVVKRRPAGALIANEAAALYSVGRVAEAYWSIERALTKILLWKFLRALMWRLRAQALFTLQRPYEALACNAEALRLARHNSAVWERQSFYLAQVGRYPEALASSVQALTYTSKSAQRNELSFLALTAQAHALNGLSRFTEALATAECAIPLNATPVRAYLAQAVALTQLGRVDEARKAAELGLSAAEKRLAAEPSVPVHAESIAYQSVLLRILGRSGEADAAAARSQSLYFQMANPNPGMAPA
jgi:tetratricopeptide (TPR) repeat protein